MTELEARELETIEARLKDLDSEFEGWQEARCNVQGANLKEVYNAVGGNIVKEAAYNAERARLLSRRNELIEVSAGVKAYLEEQKHKGQFAVSKLDGVKEDNSLNPFGGKSL